MIQYFVCANLNRSHPRVLSPPWRDPVRVTSVETTAPPQPQGLGTLRALQLAPMATSSSATIRITEFARWCLVNCFSLSSQRKCLSQVNSVGIILTIAGLAVIGNGYGAGGDGGAATAATLARPRGVAVGPLGDIYIVVQGSNKIRKVGLARVSNDCYAC